MPYTYRPIHEPRERAALYKRMVSEGVAPAAMSAGDLRMAGWLRLTKPNGGNILLAAVGDDGEIHGMALFHERDYIR